MKQVKMKKIILMAFLFSLYSFASAQDMKRMDMSKKENKTKLLNSVIDVEDFPSVMSTSNFISPGNIISAIKYHIRWK